jgi:hypothetical protein
VKSLTWTFPNFVMKSSMSMNTWTLTTITDDSWLSELYWWRCNLSGFDWCHFYPHHSGDGVSFLLQFSSP